MATDDRSADAFIAEVEHLLGRRLDEAEARLADSLKTEKTAAVVAREMEAAPIADPKKIRPEHSDVPKAPTD